MRLSAGVIGHGARNRHGAATAESTTFNILKGMDWSVNQGARIINMSFAGPKDPSLERAIKLAYDRGIVLIAAADNCGPNRLRSFRAPIRT